MSASVVLPHFIEKYGLLYIAAMILLQFILKYDLFCITTVVLPMLIEKYSSLFDLIRVIRIDLLQCSATFGVY